MILSWWIIDSLSLSLVCVYIFRFTMIPSITQIQRNLSQKGSATKINAKSNQAHTFHLELVHAIVSVSSHFINFFVYSLFKNQTNSFGILITGSRFALMELKAISFYLLLNFDLQPYEKTQIPVKLAKAAANFATEKGIHLELRQRV